MELTAPKAPDSTGSGPFPTTHWTMVEQIKGPDSSVSDRALDDLCRRYHYSLYCYLRRRGLAHHDAEDALHDFLFKLLRLNAFVYLSQEKGRLRGFLSTSLSRFLQNWLKARPYRTHETGLGELSLPGNADERYQSEHFADEDTPDRVFDRKWAQALIAGALERLAARWEGTGRLREFVVLKPVLLNGGSTVGLDSGAMAEALGISDGAVRATLNRLLRDFRQEVEAEVRRTVGEAGEVREELDQLLRAF